MRFALSASLLTFIIASSNAQLPTGLISGLSASCLGGLSTLLTNQAINTCLSLETALSTFSGTSGTSNSLVPDLEPYLANDICPMAACNATTLTSANSTITSACQAELNNGTTLVSPLTYLFTHYDTIRQAACYKNGNDLCIVQTLDSFQTSSRQNITLSYLLSFNTSTVSSLIQALARNQTALCTDCNKALFTTLAPLAASSGSAAVQGNASNVGNVFTQACGANSLGTIPSTVTESANGNSTSSTSSSSSSGGSSSGSGSTDGAGRSMVISLAALALSFAGIALVL